MPFDGREYPPTAIIHAEVSVAALARLTGLPAPDGSAGMRARLTVTGGDKLIVKLQLPADALIKLTTPLRE